MSTFVPIPNGAQVEVIYTLDGKNIENRLWFWTETGPITATELDGLAEGVFNWHVATLMPFLSSDLTLVGVIANRWDVFPPTLTSTFVGPVVGGVIEESCSANVAAVVPFNWPLGFRGMKRNKNYVPGLPDSGIQLNTITPTYVDILFEAYAALIDAARLFTPFFFWWWVAASAYEDNTPRSMQLVEKIQGPPLPRLIKLGQRRKRLPVL